MIITAYAHIVDYLSRYVDDFLAMTRATAHGAPDVARADACKRAIYEFSARAGVPFDKFSGPSACTEFLGWR